MKTGLTLCLPNPSSREAQNPHLSRYFCLCKAFAVERSNWDWRVRHEHALGSESVAHLLFVLVLFWSLWKKGSVYRLVNLSGQSFFILLYQELKLLHSFFRPTSTLRTTIANFTRTLMIWKLRLWCFFKLHTLYKNRALC